MSSVNNPAYSIHSRIAARDRVGLVELGEMAGARDHGDLGLALDRRGEAVGVARAA